jgi:anti-sigma regulatory factor (Ser/Thr protein kinase)
MTTQSKTQVLRVELESISDELANVRDFCSEVMDSFWNLDGQALDNKDESHTSLELAMNEAVANVSEHGYSNQPNQPITCVATRFNDRVQFEVLHDGKGFVPPEETPQIDMPLEGGMGLFLIEQCVDEVTYCRTDEGRQCIRLVKFFAKD